MLEKLFGVYAGVIFQLEGRLIDFSRLDPKKVRFAPRRSLSLTSEATAKEAFGCVGADDFGLGGAINLVGGP